MNLCQKCNKCGIVREFDTNIISIATSTLVMEGWYFINEQTFICPSCVDSIVSAKKSKKRITVQVISCDSCGTEKTIHSNSNVNNSSLLSLSGLYMLRDGSIQCDMCCVGE